MLNQDNKTLKDFMEKIPNVVGLKNYFSSFCKGWSWQINNSLQSSDINGTKWQNIALVDADIYGPSIAHLLDLKDKPELKNNLLQPILKYGLKIISIANLVDANQAGIWRGPMVTKILYQLIRAVNWQADNKKLML